MITPFSILIFIHIVCAILWIGSAVVLELLEWQAVRTSKRDRLATSLSRSSWFGKRVFSPAAALTILSGIIAVAIGRPEFSQLWVILALIGVVLAAGLGGGMVGRTSAKLAARIKDPAVHEDEIERELMGIRWASYLDLAVLFFILFDMVMRPRSFNGGFVTVSIIYFVLVIAGIVIRQSRHKQSQPRNLESKITTA